MICHQRLYLLMLLLLVSSCTSFLVAPFVGKKGTKRVARLAELANSNSDGDGEWRYDDDDDSPANNGVDKGNGFGDTKVPEASSSPSSFYNQLHSRHEQIQVESARTALEKQHTRSFLKRRPIKLPYRHARKWVQANLGAETKEEYEDLVENGNLRTPYIPKQPEKYYTSTREWISWDHFLKGDFDDEQPSAIQPSTGVFD